MALMKLVIYQGKTNLLRKDRKKEGASNVDRAAVSNHRYQGDGGLESKFEVTRRLIRSSLRGSDREAAVSS